MAATDDGRSATAPVRPTMVYPRLRELIVHGQLAPGSRLIETDLAERLGVSRTPVRSALDRLEQEGFVVSNRGGKQARPMVAPLTRQDAGDLFEIVGGLEGLAAAQAAKLAVGERRSLVEDLRQANQELLALAEDAEPDQSRFFELDQQFHDLYVRAAAGPRLRNLHQSVKPQAERYIRLYVSVLGDAIETSVEEHETIVAGIESGAPAKARSAVETNWQNAAQRLYRVIDQMGERGSW